jgi:uncharacterized protein YhjY with autotransporter beta-barrel domain
MTFSALVRQLKAAWNKASVDGWAHRRAAFGLGMAGALLLALIGAPGIAAAQSGTETLTGSIDGVGWNGQSYYSNGGVLYAEPPGNGTGYELAFVTFTVPANRTFTSVSLDYTYAQYGGASHTINFVSLSAAPAVSAAGQNTVRSAPALGSVASNGSGPFSLPAGFLSQMNSLSASGGGVMRIGAWGPQGIDYFGQFTAASLVADSPVTPTITSVAPISGPTGGGTSVTITGTGFSGATAVTFGGTAATGFTVNSATQITATAPARAAGTIDVRVATAGGASATSAADRFTYVAAPIVTAIAPTAGPTGGGTTVTITGTGFSGTTAVTFGATPATGFTVNSATQITATAPARSAGTIDVRVTTAGGTSATSAADQFTYVTSPTVTSIAPTSGPTGGGTTVTITGTNFTTATAVTFGATPATGFTVNSATQITATAPARSAGTIDVRVTTAGGTSATSAADQFTYVAAPTVASIAPTSGPTGGGTTVTITGTGFSGATAVIFGATPATGFTVNSAAQITATAPAASAGTIDVRITTAGGTSATSAADQFTYVAAPTVASIAPTSGPTGGGTTVTITGTGFSGTTAVTFGATPATGFTVNSATQITATAPAASAATVDVRITTGGGTSATSAADQFTYVAAPVAADRTGVTVAYNGAGTAIDLSTSVTGVHSSLAIGTAPAHGTTSVAGDVVTYTPATGYFGSDSFTYTATGPGGTSAPATVSLTVATPAAPTVAATSANVAYDSTGQAISLTASGVYATLAVGTAPAHGSVTFAGTTATYVPTSGYFGSDSFTYTATGPGGTSAPATVSLSVAAPPPPVVTPPPPATVSPTAPGGSVSVDLPTTTSGQVTSYRVTVGAEHGSAQIETVSGSGSLSGMLQISAMQIYRLRYTPAANFLGTDTVTIVATGPGGDSAPAVFTFQVPGKAPDLSAQVISNGSVTLSPTTGLTGGPFQALRITRQPAFGTVTIEGLNIMFTPGARNGGATSLDYVIDLSFGSSAAGRIDLTSNAAPSAQVLTARTLAGHPVTVRITEGAVGGPFTGAAITGITPAASATATLVQGGTAAAPTWDLTVTPQGTFTGDTVIGFTLTNAFATTAGTLTVTVDPRPDPSLDPDVRGVISSQVESARRFAGAQTDNFNRRLEQIRQGGGGGGASNMLSVNAGFTGEGSLLDPNARMRQQLGGTRQSLGDEALRARLGLQDDADRNRLRGRTSQPLGTASDDNDLGQSRDAGPTMHGADGKPSIIGVWAAGGVDWGRRDAATGARDYRFSTSGVSAGSDLKLSDSLVVGVGAGYGFDRTKVGDAGSQSEGRSVVVAAYGGWKATHSLSVDGVVGYGDLNYDSRRWATAANAGAGGYAFGDRKGDMVFGSLTLVWDQVQGRANRSVYGRVEGQSVSLDSFTESGADIYALTYDRLDFDSLSSTLGLRYDWRIERRRGVFTPAVRLEWTHAFDHAGPQSVAYADWLNSPRYGVALDGWDRDTVEVGLEGGWKVGDSLDLSAGYRATVGAETLSQGLQFRLMNRF